MLTTAADIITRFAQENGIIIGACGPEPIRLWEDDNIETPFVRYTRRQRTDPRETLPEANSIIVIGAGYGRELAFEPDDKARGRFSVGAVGRDYHTVLTDLLDRLEITLLSAGFVFECRKSVDKGPLSEKALAVRAGLGWVGKHGLVISEAFGSFFNIGYMLTTLPLTPELSALVPSDTAVSPAGARCGRCNACLRACPGGALGETETKPSFDYKRCVSYLTQRKGPLSKDERVLLGNALYGCDICQKVCGYNQNAYVGRITDIDYIMPELDGLLTLTKEEYIERFGQTAIYWRGLEVLKRNAGIALENINANDNAYNEVNDK